MIKFKGVTYHNREEVLNAKSVRQYWYQAIIYQESYGEFWEALKEVAVNYISIPHNADIDDSGQPKQLHFHCLWKLKSNQPWPSMVKWFESLGLGWNLVQPVANERKAIRYLFHLDDPDKHQYDIKEAVGNIKVEPYLNDEIEPSAILLSILNYIEINHITDIYDLTIWCIQSGYLDVLNKYQYLLCRILSQRYYNHH